MATIAGVAVPAIKMGATEWTAAALAIIWAVLATRHLPERFGAISYGLRKGAPIMKPVLSWLKTECVPNSIEYS